MKNIIFILVAINLVLAWFIYDTKSQLDDLTTQYEDLSGLDSEVIDVMSDFYLDYQDTIEIYDGNVDIYNAQIQELYDMVYELDERQQVIINYLQ